MNKKLIAFMTAMTLTVGILPCANAAYSGWADTYINQCKMRGIISGDENGNIMPEKNLTREQMAKMILIALSVDTSNYNDTEYEDVSRDRWSYGYISKMQEYAIENTKYYYPTELVTREEFLAMAAKVAGMSNMKPQLESVFQKRFADWSEIDLKYYDFIVLGFEKNFISGSDGLIRPKDYMTRAEACALLYKIIYAVENMRLSYFYQESLKQPEKTPDVQPEKNPEPDYFQDIAGTTNLIGEAEVSIEQAKQWAKNRGAHQRFIDIADIYWKYGEITGIRPDVLYAQAAKETNFGKYTGRVKPEQNNWAGIKKYGATGDEPEDHEDFPTPDDGVRGHFNHMSAYIGLEPVGEPHGRYRSVKGLSWAGTVKTVEQLGGKWCPSADYGYSIIKDYLEPMKNTKV